MMEIKRPEHALWRNSTGAKIEITPTYGIAYFLLGQAEDALLHAKPGTLEYDDALNLLRQLWAQDLIDCDHDYTEQVETDDTRWLEPDGVHARSNPDQTRCMICGAIYNECDSAWENQ